MVEALAVKLGGSIFKEDGFRKSAEYLARRFEDGERPIAVVSAPYGISDNLIEYWGWPPSEGNASYPTRYLNSVYEDLLKQMPEGPARSRTSNELEKRLENLRALLLNGDKTQEARVLAAGEDHSGIMLKGWLEELGFRSEYFDGGEAGIVVNPYGRPKIETSKVKIRSKIEGLIGPRSRVIPVVGGYVGHCEERGHYILMGRNSTDVAFALVGAAFDGSDGEIIKDVPGVLFVEPGVMATDVLEFLSYGEASQITWRGARVVHPLAIEIARENKRGIIVKDIEKGKGTRIGEKSQTTKERIVAAVSVGPVYVYTVRDPLMGSGDVGYGAKVLDVFSENKIPILDIATGANRISVTSRYANGFERVIKTRLTEIGYKPEVAVREGKSSITVTGDAMSEVPGSLHRITGVLASQGATIRGISQPDEEKVAGIGDSPSVTLIVDTDKVNSVVKALYEELGPVSNKS